MLLFVLVIAASSVKDIAAGGEVDDDGCADVDRVDFATLSQADFLSKYWEVTPVVLYNVPAQSQGFLGRMSMDGLLASAEKVSFRVPPTFGTEPEEKLQITASVVREMLATEAAPESLARKERQEGDILCQSVFQTASSELSATFQVPALFSAIMPFPLPPQSKSSSDDDDDDDDDDSNIDGGVKHRLISSIGSRGGGLHFHQHAHAVFLLTLGRKQWVLYPDHVGGW